MAATLALIWAMSDGGMFFTSCRARHLGRGQCSGGPCASLPSPPLVPLLTPLPAGEGQGLQPRTGHPGVPPAPSVGGARTLPAEERQAGVLEGLQHGRRRRPDQVPAVERGLPCSLESPVQLHQVGAHLVPPEPAHDGVDGPQPPAAPPSQRAPPGLQPGQGTGQAQPGPTRLTACRAQVPGELPGLSGDSSAPPTAWGRLPVPPASRLQRAAHPSQACGLGAHTARDSQVPQEESM